RQLPRDLSGETLLHSDTLGLIGEGLETDDLDRGGQSRTSADKGVAASGCQNYEGDEIHHAGARRRGGAGDRSCPPVSVSPPPRVGSSRHHRTTKLRSRSGT